MVRRLAGGELATSTLWVALAQALRLGIQVAYFILLARSLGSRDYGAYVGVLALVAIAAPFASLGSGSLLIKHVARAPQTFGRHWGKAVAITCVSGAILLGIVTIVARIWLPRSIPLGLVLAIGAADLVFVRLVDISAQAYQAHHRLFRTALLQLLLSPLRLLTAIVLITMTTAPTVLDWGAVYFVSGVLGAAVAVTLTIYELGRPEFLVREFSNELREGVFFSVSHSAQSSTNDVDKAMLARLGTLEATGIYAAAYRLVGVAFLPVGSLLVATYARFFQHGVQGLRATAQYARRLLRLGGCYGLFAAVGLYLLAPVLPVILGPEYREGVSAVRWLAVLPLLKAFHYFGADALTGAGYQGARTLIQVSVAVVNLLLNAWLIPLYSWQGAAAAALASDGLQGLAMWAGVLYLGRRDNQPDPSHDMPSSPQAESPHGRAARVPQ